ncbi:ubiquitin thioesterase otulin isoform X1 [Astyanax mexicanus]|uniref:Ubiquitin thioesterase otulin isoform X1 n=1 Tax=Astyanax mexicanus TaxID=7994 RepID=A0A8T2LQL1_ASTMX|nr:ubiquitin thioesterase otulin isoform X1 [Astyanax mexicanus]
MGNFCITTSGEEDLHSHHRRGLTDMRRNGKSAKEETNPGNKESLLLDTVKSSCEEDAGGASSAPLTMKPAKVVRKEAQNPPPKPTDQTKTTRAEQGPDSTAHSRTKRPRRGQRSTLENPGQTQQQSAGNLNPSQPNGETREMTSDMKPTPEAEATRSSHDHQLSQQQCPAGLSGAEDENSELDLYRTAEEIEQERQEKHQLYKASLVPDSEDQYSVAAPECLLSYSQREWRGNTSKSRLIKKGYEAIGEKFESLRIVRGDNYCALRATLFQILSQSQKLPDWLKDSEVFQWPKQMQTVQELVDQWKFPPVCKKEGRAVEHLESCLNLLKTRWQEAVQCESPAERESVCQKVFVGQSEEYELLEALKFLMLKTAVQLHSNMEKGSDVPEFCWLLFARDTSKCPKSFLTNHLRHVGFSGGLEQVEMFLLGYSLQQTIQVYRLYKTDTEEFITYYPDDHRTLWPNLSLVTEDDRHYNVPVPKLQASKFDEMGRPKWNVPSGVQSQERRAAPH